MITLKDRVKVTRGLAESNDEACDNDYNAEATSKDDNFLVVACGLQLAARGRIRAQRL